MRLAPAGPVAEENDRVGEMSPSAEPSSAGPHQVAAASRASRILSWVLLGLLAALLVEVLFEAWVQIQLATIRVQGDEATAVLPGWPKDLKNGLYLCLAALTVAKVAVDRRWRDFTTKADIAIVVLAVALTVAGLAGGSPLQLVGEGVYVYLRGAIVFYAWRALDPPWPRVRPLLWVLGAIVAFNALVASAQIFLGRPSYEALGWVDMTWAKLHRAHALFDHPNHLGHVLGFALLGLLSWFVTRQAKVPRRWWLLFALLALGLSASQSRESVIAVVLGGALIWFLRRGRGRTVATALLVVVTLFAAQMALRPKNMDELERRVRGVLAALKLASGEEPKGSCVRGDDGCDEENAIPQREVRILFAQQGVRLWLASPVVGYGVGQFGGIVALKHDPQWFRDPRFGPDGFDMHHFEAQQVDSFWLHLLVETGLVGVLAYLLWLVFLALPLLSNVARGRPDRIRGPTGPGSPFAYWGLSSVLFAVLVAALSPSLEDQLLPPLLFTILGLAWVDRRRPLLPAMPTTAPDTTATQETTAKQETTATQETTAAQDTNPPNGAGEDGPRRGEPAPRA